jgi:hypothetical protein
MRRNFMTSILAKAAPRRSPRLMGGSAIARLRFEVGQETRQRTGR